MKIGLFTDSYLPLHDGVATAVAALARELKASGHDVYIIAPKKPHYNDRWKHVIRIFSIRLFKSPEFRVGVELPQISLLKAWKLDFDIIHGHSGGPISMIGWQIARSRRIPYVLTYHTMWKAYSRFYYHRIFPPSLLVKMSALAANASDTIIVPTQKVQRALISYGVKKPIRVIPSGIYTERFENIRKGFVREQFSISKSKRIILTVGRLGKEKAIDFLLASFAIAARIEPNLVFVIVGEGKDGDFLQEYANRLGVGKHVYFIGTVASEDMPKVYSDADLFIFSSHTETQGLVILEAMASGLPVVAVDDSAFEEVIENGVNGYTVNKDVSHFARKIVDIMRIPDVRWQMGKNAQKTAEKFSVQGTTKKIEDVYIQLCSRKPGWNEETL